MASQTPLTRSATSMDRLEGQALTRSPPGSGGPSANDHGGPPGDEAVMARLERMSSAQGRRQLSLAGRQAMQSVRDGLEEMRRRPSMRERAEIAAAALDGKPLQRAATQPTPPAPPLKRTLTAPRSRSVRLRPQEAAQELSRTLSISDEATKEPPETLLFSWGRGALLHDGDATAALSALSARGYTPIDVIESSDGSTALMNAAAFGHPAIVLRLLRAGADTKLRLSLIHI